MVLAPALTVSDPDAGASVTSAQVAIDGFTAGDVLTVTPAAGIAAAYNAATGVLTLTGPASDAAYQRTLETVTFGHDGSVDAGSRTVTFTVTDDGAASTSAAETVLVSGYTQPARAGAAAAARRASPTWTPSRASRRRPTTCCACRPPTRP